MELKEWFFEKFMEFQRASGKFTSQAAFAEYLGIKPAYMNHLMNGRAKKISMEFAQQVAERSGAILPFPKWIYPKRTNTPAPLNGGACDNMDFHIYT